MSEQHVETYRSQVCDKRSELSEDFEHWYVRHYRGDNLISTTSFVKGNAYKEDALTHALQWVDFYNF